MEEWSVTNWDLVRMYMRQRGYHLQQQVAKDIKWSEARVSNAVRSKRLNGELLVALLNQRKGSGLVQGVGLRSEEAMGGVGGKEIV